jgi:HSP20 family protein
MDELQRRLNRLFDEFDVGRWPEIPTWRLTTWPMANLYDNGKELVLRAQVPGLSEKDVRVNAHQDVLTISGERKSDAPEGYSVHRQERGQVKFSRSFTCPCKIDLEKVSANVKNGILTVNMPKVPEAQPRQITVKAH